MTKFSSMIENLKARQEAMASEGAFSLIDVVVTVAIVVALSVGGFIAYNGIVDNAKSAATAAAADQVYTASLVSMNDGFAGESGDNSPTGIATAYNASSDAIKVLFVLDSDATAAGNQSLVIAAHQDSDIANTAWGTPAAPFTVANTTASGVNADMIKTRAF